MPRSPLCVEVCDLDIEALALGLDGHDEISRPGTPTSAVFLNASARLPKDHRSRLPEQRLVLLVDELYRFLRSVCSSLQSLACLALTGLLSGGVRWCWTSSPGTITGMRVSGGRGRLSTASTLGFE